jgi:hypothetical protein
MQQDLTFDVEARTYQWEYDSENDDPDVASVYYHLRESDKGNATGMTMEHSDPTTTPHPKKPSKKSSKHKPQ